MKIDTLPTFEEVVKYLRLKKRTNPDGSDMQ